MSRASSTSRDEPRSAAGRPVAEEEQSLRAIGLLASLTDAELRTFEVSCTWRYYRRDEQIIDRKSSTQDVYFIVGGAVRVVNYSLSGREVSFEDIGEGNFFGELAAIDGAPRSANVVALEDSLLAVMAPHDFTRLVSTHPPVVLGLLERMAGIIRSSTRRIMELSTVGAPDRVYGELLRMARPHLQGDGTAVIRPVPIHADIAARVSTTRETVARVLSELARKGLVERRGDALVVDCGRLQLLLDETAGV